MKLKDNPNPPHIRFVRIRGRIVPMANGNPNHKAEKVLKQNIDEMDFQVQAAEAGRRMRVEDGSREGKWVAKPSTFPKFFGEIGFKAKKQWTSAMEKKDGAAFDSIVNHAAAQTNFKIAAKQVFDNENVVFKNIGGIVRPIRSKNPEFYSWTPKKEKK